MVIRFPSDSTSRTEKIKQIQETQERSKLGKLNLNQINKINPQGIQASLNPKPTTKFTINVANVSELSKNIEHMDDTLKYVTDCIYDFSVTLEKFRKNVLVMFFVSIASIFASIFIWKFL